MAEYFQNCQKTDASLHKYIMCGPVAIIMDPKHSQSLSWYISLNYISLYKYNIYIYNIIYIYIYIIIIIMIVMIIFGKMQDRLILGCPQDDWTSGCSWLPAQVVQTCTTPACPEKRWSLIEACSCLSACAVDMGTQWVSISTAIHFIHFQNWRAHLKNPSSLYLQSYDLWSTIYLCIYLSVYLSIYIF